MQRYAHGVRVSHKEVKSPAGERGARKYNVMAVNNGPPEIVRRGRRAPDALTNRPKKRRRSEELFHTARDRPRGLVTMCNTLHKHFIGEHSSLLTTHFTAKVEDYECFTRYYAFYV